MGCICPRDQTKKPPSQALQAGSVGEQPPKRKAEPTRHAPVPMVTINPKPAERKEPETLMRMNSGVQ